MIVSDPVQISQIRHGKSPSCQPALIVSDPVQISQIRHGKSPLSQPALIMSDLVQFSQIRYEKSCAKSRAKGSPEAGYRDALSIQKQNNCFTPFILVESVMHSF